MKAMWTSAVLAVITLGSPVAAQAANKEHQQLMAEIRMLQEQQTQIQHLIGGLTDALNQISSKMDNQAGVTRKAFADQTLQLNSISEAARILREKSDDTNVRLSTMTQEIQSLRQTVASMPTQTLAAPMPGADPTMAGVPQTGAQPPVNTNNPPPTNISPTRMFDQAYADYTAGQFDLAIAGFEAFIRTFPTSPNADDAQLYIGYSLYSAGKSAEALAALQKVISDYPQSDKASAAYYKMGLTFESLKQLDNARKAFEMVVKNYPSSMDATLATQALERLKRRNE
ncbi:MAG TPA: tol-pal system protein YbgF [Vicinamibacterales bacterium]|nr:tol-pal system protein YbgF [Vicinamibacterales bacterium]